MAYYLAVDAGGTKTDFALADETHILARAQSATIKLLRTDAASASSALEEALRKLTAVSDVPMSAVHRTCIGTAGETVPSVTDFLRRQFAARVAGQLEIVGDVIIALDAAFRGGRGVLVLAGTGSNVVGLTSQGQMVRAGGWGPALGDQGSGYGIGHAALRAAFAALDAECPTLLVETIRKFWGLPSLEALVGFANGTPSPDFSRLAPLVVACAEASDPVARQVLIDEGRELGHLVCLVIGKMRAAAKEKSHTPDLACAGSILKNVTVLREAMVAAVRCRYPDVGLVAACVDPIAGALWRARRAEQA